MLRILLAVAALVLFMKCSRKFGFRIALTWAALIVISVFPFTLAAGFASRPAHWLWSLLSMKTRIVMLSALVVVVLVAVKEKGLGETLRWAFALALLGCFFVFAFFLPILIALASQGAR